MLRLMILLSILSSCSSMNSRNTSSTNNPYVGSNGQYLYHLMAVDSHDSQNNSCFITLSEWRREHVRKNKSPYILSFFIDGIHSNNAPYFVLEKDQFHTIRRAFKRINNEEKPEMLSKSPIPSADNTPGYELQLNYNEKMDYPEAVLLKDNDIVKKCIIRDAGHYDTKDIWGYNPPVYP